MYKKGSKLSLKEEREALIVIFLRFNSIFEQRKSGLEL